MSHQSYPAFNYTPLQPGCIRVLRPSTEPNGDLTWSMITIQPGEDKPFDALSYVWGDQSQTFPFICNDQEFRIHHNLSNALPYLAKRDSPRPIWIDALCINQRDEDEKAAQIRFMYQVYRQATQVWIWFGCGTEKTSEAISFLPRLSYVIDMVGDDFGRPTFQSMGLPSSRHPLWEEVLGILCNEWFERLWVVQEALLARDIRVLRGHHEIGWNTLTKMVTKMGNLMSFRDDSQAHLQIEAASSWEVPPQTSLTEFINDGLVAFLLNNRSVLNSYDLPSLLSLLQSNKVSDLILQWSPAFLPDKVRPLWLVYYASIGDNIETFQDEFLSFLMPGRWPRHMPQSEYSYSTRDRLVMGLDGALPPFILDSYPGSVWDDSPAPISDYLPISLPDDRLASISDDPPIVLPDDKPASIFDDPPISLPDDWPASISDNSPISLPTNIPANMSDNTSISLQDDKPPDLTEALFNIAISQVYSSPSRGRMLAIADIERLLAARPTDRPPNLSDVLQAESHLGLRLNLSRVLRPFNMVMMVETWKGEPQSTSSVLVIVWKTTGSQACFDPRDRVFGTFGFFGETLPSEFSLSHRMSLEELYSTFVQYLLVESAAELAANTYVESIYWATLHRATLPGKRSPLPSWCPDLNQKVDDKFQLFDGTISYFGMACRPCFKAGKSRPIMIERGMDWSEIRLRGRVFDSVSVLHSTIPNPCLPDTTEIASSGIIRAETLRMSAYHLAVWESELAARVVEAPVGGIKSSDMFEVYWQTLVGNQLPQSSSITRQHFLDFQTGLRRVRDLFDKVGVIKRLEDGTLVEAIGDWQPSTPEEEDIYSFIVNGNSSPYGPVSLAMQLGLWNNRPFTTKSGRFGYGRSSMEEGDLLCVFDGSTTAHLIRRRVNSPPSAEVYQLVSEAFVHGMMHGEIDDLDIEGQGMTLV